MRRKSMFLCNEKMVDLDELTFAKLDSTIIHLTFKNGVREKLCFDTQADASMTFTDMVGSVNNL